MQAQNLSSSAAKATTPARHLVATEIIGAAVIGYLCTKPLNHALASKASVRWPAPWAN